jgi:hypothetical protein
LDLAGWYATGKYQDFILLDQEVYPLPPGFQVEPSLVETSNIVTMASGRRRRDLIRRSYKYKLSWAKSTQAGVTQLDAIYEASLAATSIRFYTKKSDPTDVTDYQVNTVDLIDPIKYKPAFRGRGLFIYEAVSLEMA